MMKKYYSIDSVCLGLGISRQGLNARCRKLGIEKTREGRRAYFTHQQIKILEGGKTSTIPEKDDTERFEGSQTGDERLLERLLNENDYLRKKLDDESENLKGMMGIVIQNNERIKKLEGEKRKLLEYKGLDISDRSIMENDGEREWKKNVSKSPRKWYHIFTGE